MHNVNVLEPLSPAIVVEEPTTTDNRPLYNSRIINSFIKLIKTHYSYIDINDLLKKADMELYQVEDEGHWFTQKQVDIFYEHLRNITGNDNIARDAGRYAASPDSIGVMRQYALGLTGPARAYEMVGKYAHNFSRSASYESKKIGATKIEITVTPKEGVNEKQYQCENRIGTFEAISTIFNYRLPRIQHPECIFKGGATCRYEVSWSASHSAFLKTVRNYLAFFLLIFGISLHFTSPELVTTLTLSLSVFLILIISLGAEMLEKKELSAAIDSLRGSTDQLLEKIDANYNNALLINEIGLALSHQTELDGILTKIVQTLQKRLDYDRGMILLANDDKTRLAFRAGFGYLPEQLSILENTGFHLDRPESRGVFVMSFHRKKPFLINDFSEIKDYLSPRSLDFAKKMGTKSFICCPIVYEEEALGVLAVDNIKKKKPLLQTDMSLLTGIAPEIGISIHNALLIEQRELQFKSILQVLAASIDARDPLTAGHSAKVTEYAVGICHELGMPRDYCEMVRVASLLHDYGKIGIKDSILKKEGSLTLEEHEEIKSHVQKTKTILEQINFHGIYKEVPEIASSHHEKINGSGYPKGLKGKEIPLGARILAVADFFEAVTARRHYRDPMSVREAMGLLWEHAGSHFDSTIIAAFTRYYTKEYMLETPPSAKPTASLQTVQ
ncbi:MAG: HD domain-containing phosphohydrolase [Dissulfurispiraceae bacterium]